jgi:NIMA-interacting peptidyl-prolyl cis-trans isomerase 4
MAKGASKDKKPAEKKGGEKGKGKSEDAADTGGKVSTGNPVSQIFFPDIGIVINQGKGGLKAATAVNVRHILCEKHSKATEALQRIQVRRKT